MGWSSGSRLMSEIIEAIEDNVSNYETKVEIFKVLIEKFEDYDCDNLNECLDESIAFEEAYKSIHEDYGWDDEEDE